MDYSILRSLDYMYLRLFTRQTPFSLLEQPGLAWRTEEARRGTKRHEEALREGRAFFVFFPVQELGSLRAMRHCSKYSCFLCKDPIRKILKVHGKSQRTQICVLKLINQTHWGACVRVAQGPQRDWKIGSARRAPIFFCLVTAIPNSSLGYGHAWTISRSSSLKENKSSYALKTMERVKRDKSLKKVFRAPRVRRKR